MRAPIPETSANTPEGLIQCFVDRLYLRMWWIRCQTCKLNWKCVQRTFSPSPPPSRWSQHSPLYSPPEFTSRVAELKLLGLSWSTTRLGQAGWLLQGLGCSPLWRFFWPWKLTRSNPVYSFSNARSPKSNNEETAQTSTTVAPPWPNASGAACLFPLGSFLQFLPYSLLGKK